MLFKLMEVKIIIITLHKVFEFSFALTQIRRHPLCLI